MKALFATLAVLAVCSVAQAQSGWSMDLGGGQRYYSFGDGAHGWSNNLGGGISSYNFHRPYRNYDAESYYYQPRYNYRYSPMPQFRYHYDSYGNYRWYYGD